MRIFSQNLSNSPSVYMRVSDILCLGVGFLRFKRKRMKDENKILQNNKPKN